MVAPQVADPPHPLVGQRMFQSVMVQLHFGLQEHAVHGQLLVLSRNVALVGYLLLEDLLADNPNQS